MDLVLMYLSVPLQEYTVIAQEVVSRLPQEELDEGLMVLTPWWSWLDPAWLAQSASRDCLTQLLVCFYMDHFMTGSTKPEVRRILEKGFRVH